jgi:hypothetical protein
MHSMPKTHAAMTRRPQSDLGLWCISGLVVRDSLPTPGYPASSREPKFARNQEAGP